MPLSTALPILELDIKDALDSMIDNARSGGDGSQSVDIDKIHQELAQKLSTAIDKYVKQAIVVTTVNTAVVGAGGTPPGPVVGTGFGACNGTLQ